MSTTNNTFDRVVSILRDNDIDETIELTPDSTFEEIGLDSLAVVEIAMQCEDEFGITIEMEENPKTLGQFVDFVNSLLEKKE